MAKSNRKSTVANHRVSAVRPDPPSEEEREDCRKPVRLAASHPRPRPPPFQAIDHAVPGKGRRRLPQWTLADEPTILRDEKQFEKRPRTGKICPGRVFLRP